MAKRKPPGRQKNDPRGSRGGSQGGSQAGSGRPRHKAGAPTRPGAGARYWLYGRHAARAALANPARAVLRALATPEALGRLEPDARKHLEDRGIAPETASRAALDAVLPPGAVHQGLVLEVRPLQPPALAAWLADLAPVEPARRSVLVALDQVSDPHNAGAVLRSAAAFGARAVLAPRHGQAPESGVLAKAASGALDTLPYLDAGNLARALGLLKEKGFWILGLAGDAEATLEDADPGGPAVLVLGGEGKGLRRLTREACDLLARLPTRPPIDQLNVSNAAAVALYQLLGRSATA